MIQISFLSIPYTLVIKSNQKKLQFFESPKPSLEARLWLPSSDPEYLCLTWSSAEYLLLRVSEVVTFGTLSQAVTAFIPCVSMALSSCQLSQSCDF